MTNGLRLGEKPDSFNDRRIGEAAAFRARVEERLKGLESEVAELRTRINGLLFFIAGTVIAQVILKLVA